MVSFINIVTHSPFGGDSNGYLSFKANDPIVIVNPSQNKQKTIITHVGIFTASSGAVAIS